MHLPDYVYRVLFGRHRPLKLPLNCEIVEKRCLGDPILGGGYTSDFGHAFSNRTYFGACGRLWLSSVQRARRVGDKKEEEERIPVKPTSADDYFGRHNKWIGGCIFVSKIRNEMRNEIRTSSPWVVRLSWLENVLLRPLLVCARKITSLWVQRSRQTAELKINLCRLNYLLRVL